MKQSEKGNLLIIHVHLRDINYDEGSQSFKATLWCF